MTGGLPCKVEVLAFRSSSKPELSLKHPLPGLTRGPDQCGESWKNMSKSVLSYPKGTKETVKEKGKEPTVAHSQVECMVSGRPLPSLKSHKHTGRQSLIKSLASIPYLQLVARQNLHLESVGIGGRKQLLWQASSSDSPYDSKFHCFLR